MEAPRAGVSCRRSRAECRAGNVGRPRGRSGRQSCGVARTDEGRHTDGLDVAQEPNRTSVLGRIWRGSFRPKPELTQPSVSRRCSLSVRHRRRPARRQRCHSLLHAHQVIASVRLVRSSSHQCMNRGVGASRRRNSPMWLNKPALATGQRR